MAIVRSRPQFTGYAENIFHNVLREPTGFLDREETSIDFDPNTREFTLTPTNGSTEAWVRGKRIYIPSTLSITISDTPGNHFIYLDDQSNGQLLERNGNQGFTPDLLQQFALIAAIYWSPDHQVAASIEDHRHGIGMNGATLYYFDETIGITRIEGLGLDNINADQSGNDDEHTQFSVNSGLIRNKDLREEIVDGDFQTLSPAAQIPIIFREGSNGEWNLKEATDFPVIESGTAGFDGTDDRPAWNQNDQGTWQLSTVPRQDYYLMHYFAVPDIRHHIVGVVGQATYHDPRDAESEAATELALLQLPFKNALPIGSVIFETRSQYNNPAKSRIRKLENGNNYIDWRTVTSLNVAISGAGVTDHGLLNGLEDDDHPQYLNEERGDARYYTQSEVDDLVDISSPVSTDTSVDVPYDQTTTLDSCDCSRAKWSYYLINESDETLISGQVDAHRINETVTWNWYAITGDISSMKHQIDVTYDSSDEEMLFQVTNNDTDQRNWTASIIRTKG